MGKKSKKSGAAKAKGSASSATAAASGVGSGGGSSELTSIAGKKQKCVRCCSTLKELSKAHACPGCSLLYCWRCVRKDFSECPNGRRCVHQVSRCSACMTKTTMLSALKEAGVEEALSENVRQDGTVALYSNAYDIFHEIIQGTERLTLDATPFIACSGEGCKLENAIECYRCLIEPTKTLRLARCSVCLTSRCKNCRVESVITANSDAMKVMNELGSRVVGMEAKDIEPALIDMAAGSIRHALPDNYFIRCRGCLTMFCLQCLDDKSAQILAKCFLFDMANGRGKPITLVEDFICGHCYWSAKPCTNPNCPNEVGVPTKRCGGCHLDRYCSVECQAAAYPCHVGRCKKIQAKRAAAGKHKKD